MGLKPLDSLDSGFSSPSPLDHPGPFDSVTDPYKHIGSGIIRSGLVGVGVPLLKEVYHCRMSFEISYVQATLSEKHNLFLMLSDQDV